MSNVFDNAPSDAFQQFPEAVTAMHEQFWAYYPLTDEQTQDFWRDAFITFDASVLIDLYQYSPTVVGDFFQILEINQKRVWLSHQAALEYQRHRVKGISGQLAEYKKLRDAIKAMPDTIRRIVKGIDDARDPKAKDVQDALRAVENKVRDYQKSQSAVGFQEPQSGTDSILERLSEIFGSAETLGTAFPKPKLKRIYRKGRRRYAAQIPPGYEDAAEKPEPRRYGDLIIWEQILAEAKKRRGPFIFVTHDVKLDWWRHVGDRPFAPRPELREEARRRVDTDCWFYQLDDFLRNAKKYLNATVSDDTIEEVSEELHQIAEPPDIPVPLRFPPSTAPPGFETSPGLSRGFRTFRRRPTFDPYALDPYALDLTTRTMERLMGEFYADVGYDRFVRSIERAAGQATDPFEQWLYGRTTNTSAPETGDSAPSDVAIEDKGDDAGEAG